MYWDLKKTRGPNGEPHSNKSGGVACSVSSVVGLWTFWTNSLIPERQRHYPTSEGRNQSSGTCWEEISKSTKRRVKADQEVLRRVKAAKKYWVKATKKYCRRVECAAVKQSQRALAESKQTMKYCIWLHKQRQSQRRRRSTTECDIFGGWWTRVNASGGFQGIGMICLNPYWTFDADALLVFYLEFRYWREIKKSKTNREESQALLWKKRNV